MDFGDWGIEDALPSLFDNKTHSKKYLSVNSVHTVTKAPIPAAHHKLS